MAIGDNNLPIISFDSSDFRYDEANDSVTFTLSLSEASSSAITVEYGTIDGSAHGESVDYDTATAGVLEFDAGETTVTGTVYIRHDLIAETDESFFISLFNPAGATFGGRNHSLQAPLFILDNDFGGGEPSFSIAAPVVVEGSGRATFEISISEPFDEDTTVRYATVSDSAVAREDFTPRPARSPSPRARPRPPSTWRC